MNEEIHCVTNKIRCITNKGKTAKNEWENDELIFEFYILHIPCIKTMV